MPRLYLHRTDKQTERLFCNKAGGCGGSGESDIKCSKCRKYYSIGVKPTIFFKKKNKKNAIVHITVHYQIKNPKQNTLYVHRKDKLKEVHCSYQLISLQLFVCAAANNTASSSRSAGRDLTISTKQRLFTASPCACWFHGTLQPSTTIQTNMKIVITGSRKSRK